MKHRLLLSALVAAAMLAPALPARSVTAQATTQPSADAIITRASRTWQTLGSFQADFRMKLDDPLIDHEESKGRLYQSGANRFAMRFTDPANSVIVIDGVSLWVYLPENDPRNVIKQPAPAGAIYGYNHLAWLFDRPNEKYRATWLRAEPIEGKTADVLRLEPVTSGMPFRRATVWIDRESVLPRKLELDEKLLVRTITLSRIRTNGTLPPGIFTFRVPDGVRVIEQ